MCRPDLPTGLETLIADIVRGDPGASPRWPSRSRRQRVTALTTRGCEAGRRVVTNLPRELIGTCQADRNTREGSHYPDRNAPFRHFNVTVQTAVAAGEPAISVDAKRNQPIGVLTRRLQQQRERRARFGVGLRK